MFVALFAPAFAEPLHADKRIYNLAVEGGLGALPAAGTGDWGVGRGAVLGRLTNHLLVDADLSLSPAGSFHTETGEVARPRAVRGGGGVAWSFGGTGLHGVQLGARALVGPVSYAWTGETFCTTPGGGTYGGTCPSFPSPTLPEDGVRVEIQPNVRGRWVGHPGLALGFEIGMNVVTGELVEREQRATPYGFVMAGWAVPLGDRWTTEREALAALSPETAERRRAQSRVVTIAVATVATGTALGVGGTALWLATHAPAFGR